MSYEEDVGNLTPPASPPPNGDPEYARPFPLPSWSSAPIALYLAAVGGVGAAANALVVWLFCKNSVVRTPLNYLLLNMVLAELTIALLAVPVDIYAAARGGWFFGKPPCVLSGFVITFTGMVSLLTLVSLSVQRMLSVWWPRRCKGLSTSRAAQVVAAVWLSALALTAPPLFGWGKYVPETSGLSCAPNWESADAASYVWYLLTLGFLLPLAVIFATSVATIKKIRQMSGQVLQASVRRRSLRRSRRSTRLVLAMNLAFLTCWMPYGALCLTRFLFGERFLPMGSSALSMLLAKTSICFNPFLYVYLNPQFGGALPFILPFKRKSSGSKSKGAVAVVARRAIRFQENPENGNASGRCQLAKTTVLENKVMSNRGSRGVRYFAHASSAGSSLGSYSVAQEAGSFAPNKSEKNGGLVQRDAHSERTTIYHL